MDVLGIENNFGRVATMPDARFTRRRTRFTPIASGLVLNVNRDFHSPLKTIMVRRRTEMPATMQTAMRVATLVSCRDMEKIAIANKMSLCQGECHCQTRTMETSVLM